MGLKTITYRGRAYPTAEQARTRMRKTLEILGVPFDPANIRAVEETPGAICPWGAEADIEESDWIALQERKPSQV